MSSPLIERMVQAMVADLREQEDKSGSTVDHEGTSVQVDGSFDLARVAAAALRVVREADSVA